MAPGSRQGAMARREFLRLGAAAGLGAVTSSLGAAGVSARPAAKAKAVIQLFMFGGPSQMDLFDYKPELQRSSGKTVTHERRTCQLSESVLLGSPYRFRQHGETGQWCSDAFRHLPAHMHGACMRVMRVSRVPRREEERRGRGRRTRMNSLPSRGARSG